MPETQANTDQAISLSTAQAYPAYILRPNIARIFLPKIILLAPLAILLYIGAYLNLKFLQIQNTTLLNLSVFVVIFILVAFDLLFEYRKALHLEYSFYLDRLYANGKWLMYNAIQHIDAKRDALDKMVKTCCLVIDSGNGDKTELKYVSDAYNIYQYIQNLVTYSKSSEKITFVSQK